MWRILKARFQQKYRTFPYPRRKPILPELFRGRPLLEPRSALSGETLQTVCPTGALTAKGEGRPALDMGRCIFCGKCAATGCVSFSKDHVLAASSRRALILNGDSTPSPAFAVDANIKKLFGRSLKLRQVSAGGCNACEADTNVLNTPLFDLGRFGIQFVASPRHADGLLITGPVTKNMALALQKTYAAVPAPKVVIAVGACAISGGIFAGHEEVCDGVEHFLKVDLFIPGCPPHPWTILDGLLRLIGRIS